MVDKPKAEKCARAAKKAKAVQAVVCHSDACSLADMQHCLALLKTLAAGRAAEHAATDTCILPGAAVVITFGVLRR